MKKLIEKLRSGNFLSGYSKLMLEAADAIEVLQEWKEVAKTKEAQLAEKDREIERLKEQLEHSEIERKQMELFMRTHI
jgi:uncharacterized protein with WD repeat